jgi:hypothetical protein
MRTWGNKNSSYSHKYGLQWVQNSWALPNNLKHNEVTFLMGITELYLHVHVQLAQMTKSSDLATFVLTMIQAVEGSFVLGGGGDINNHAHENFRDTHLIKVQRSLMAISGTFIQTKRNCGKYAQFLKLF